MSSKLNDINVLTFQAGNTQPSSAVVTNVTGTAVDMRAHDNNCFAVQRIGSIAGTEITYVGKMQEAVTLTGTYADISGAVFVTITSTTAHGGIQTINFQRTLGWVRYVGTIAGTTSGVALDVMIVGQKKQL